MQTNYHEASRQDAKRAGLRYSSDHEPGITRRKRGQGWSFYGPGGKLLRAEGVRQRCLSLAVPPAYEDVWICRDENGHLQATGRDAKGRKVYLYHPEWRRIRDEKKYDALAAFGERLGAARDENEALRRGRTLTRARVLAAMFRLLDLHALRVGNAAYAEENGSYGATTLCTRHFDPDEAVLKFKGKSGRARRIELGDRRLGKFMRRLSDLPGQPLFQYQDEDGEWRQLGSEAVNAYLHGLFGENVSAKTFRTWHGSVAAFEAGLEEGAKVDDVLTAAAERLGNTKAIARSSYVHPRLIEEVKNGALSQAAKELRCGRNRKGLTSQETAFMRWLGS